MVGISSPADAVTVGAITAFPDRDMVGVSGYNVGEVLTVRVLRGGPTGAEVARVTAAAVPSDDGGGGLEINHGPEGAVQDGDCWEGATPANIILADDVIEVTSSSRHFTDTMAVEDVRLVGAPQRVGGNVEQSISSTIRPEARFRFRDGSIDFRSRPPVTGTTPSFTAVFDPASDLEAQRAMAAAWRADVVGADAGVTIAESDGVDGHAEGCGGGTVPPEPPEPPGDAAPGQTVIGQAARGAAGAPLTAIARWTPPTTGGAPTGDVVRAFPVRSEERRVGEGGRSRGAPHP